MIHGPRVIEISDVTWSLAKYCLISGAPFAVLAVVDSSMAIGECRACRAGRLGCRVLVHFTEIRQQRVSVGVCALLHTVGIQRVIGAQDWKASSIHSVGPALAKNT
jgi:hypothetical protein